MIEEITATELKAALEAGPDIQLIDVRQPDEYAFAHDRGAKLIPMGEIMSAASKRNRSRPRDRRPL